MSDYKDRGMMKYQPFDSLTNSLAMKHELQLKKNKITKPTLSEDQLEQIDLKIKEAYYNNDSIKIYYYSNGKILNKANKILRIDNIKKIIVLNDNTKIFYKQIVDVKNI